VEARQETPRVRTLLLDLPRWPGHRPGQHVDVRLTAEDGYRAVRSYSIASPPEEARVALTVERLDDGEVSPYLVDDVVDGDRLEVRGPIGGYFVWTVPTGGPLFLVGGGSGIVPLLSMIRHRVRQGSDVPIRLLYSVRTSGDVIARAELERLAAEDNGVEVFFTFTRERPEGWTGYTGRVDRALLEEVAWPPGEEALTYVCGPTQFVETVADRLVDLGHTAGRVRTERFGATGR
jgi:ferredoxin-NADP reductase